MMKSIRFLVMVFVLCLVAPAAFAEIQYVDYIDPAATSPTVTACKAQSSLKQSCRQCHTNYAADGVTVTGVVCRYVWTNASCKCNLGNYRCTTEGSCTYV